MDYLGNEDDEEKVEAAKQNKKFRIDLTKVTILPERVMSPPIRIYRERKN